MTATIHPCKLSGHIHSLLTLSSNKTYKDLTCLWDLSHGSITVISGAEKVLPPNSRISSHGGIIIT
jgi:hypothetical protein